jgi:hypothetical protein
VRPKTHLLGNTALELSSHQIQRWMNDCILGHEQCSNQSKATLPTRVLDLGNTNESIRLIETHELAGPYICLSHCWGGHSTILCTRETYAGYQDNVPWDTLPLLFQDTVKVCRMLDVRYLWIDKLCIIQHDADDWAREGSKMAQVFEGVITYDWSGHFKRRHGFTVLPRQEAYCQPETSCRSNGGWIFLYHLFQAISSLPSN